MDTPVKYCSKCKREYSATLEYFPRRDTKKYKDGLDCWCKACHAASADKRRAQNGKSKGKYSPTHKTCSICKQEFPRTIEYFHPRVKGGHLFESRCIKCHKQYYQEHKDEYRKQGRAYNRTHRMERRANWQAYRARKQAAGGVCTKKDVAYQYKAQKGHCYYCARKVGSEYHVDHVIPLSRGGSNSPENIVIACPECNTSKQDKLPHEWQRGGKLL